MSLVPLKEAKKRVVEPSSQVKCREYSSLTTTAHKNSTSKLPTRTQDHDRSMRWHDPDEGTESVDTLTQHSETVALLQEQLKRLGVVYNSKKRECDDAYTDKAVLEAERDELQRMVGEERDAKVELTTFVDDLYAEVVSLQKQLIPEIDEREEDMRQLQEQLAASERYTQELQGEVDGYERQVQMLKKKLAWQAKTIGNNDEALAKARDKHQEVADLNDTLKTKVGKLKKRLLEKETKVERDRLQRTKKFLSLELETEGLREAEQLERSKRIEAEERLKQCLCDVEEARDQCRNQADVIESLEAEMETQKVKYKEKITKMKTSHETTRNSLFQKTEELAGEQSNTKSILTKLEKKDDALSAAYKTMKKRAREMEDLRKLAKATKNDLTKLEEQYHEQENDIENLHAKVFALKNENKSLRDQLDVEREDRSRWADARLKLLKEYRYYEQG